MLIIYAAPATIFLIIFFSFLVAVFTINNNISMHILNHIFYHKDLAGTEFFSVLLICFSFPVVCACLLPYFRF